ncbi:MAG TPA: glycosyl hydrolase family 17 protein [Chloroflexaceae bacterium]|mgnify:CR=1 FL=1|nr:glycosyl hydrolase family 17 protein [Chloroflexaceae bacterium]
MLRFLARALMIALLAAVLPLGAVEAQDGRQCFAETSFCISGRFLSYWQQNGGLPVFGYPLGPPHTIIVDGREIPVQWFERARLELHAEQPPPYDVLLGRLGDDLLRARGTDWRSGRRTDAAQPGCLWFAQTGREVCDQAPGLGFLSYWQSHGLEDPRLGSYERSLALFGLPLTDAVEEVSKDDGRTYVTQWFERARFEWHPEQPDEFKVLLGLLGKESHGPRPIAGPPSPYRLHGLNFGPYTDAQDPRFDPRIGPDRLRSLLEVVAPATEWVRTYSSTNGIEQVGPIARSLGLKVAMGAWLGRDAAANEQELNALIQAAQAGYVDVAIVGSETLYREDLTARQLSDYLQRVQQALPGIPVAVADSYASLAANPAVLADADLVLANYYPYWEGIGIQHAMSAVNSWHHQLVTLAAGKPVWVSETGWPSCGGRQGDALASPENASFYALSFTSWARANGVPYFYFAAFDEPWKRAEEGPQGACWGLWDAGGAAKGGVDLLLRGATVPDSWSAQMLPGGPGTPEIILTSVPTIGSSEDLRGQVNHVSPFDYRVVVYIKAGGGWWLKPYRSRPLTTIRPDGSWICDITTGGIDERATEIAAFLVPVGYTPPILSGSGALPAELEQRAVAKVQVSR